MADHVVKTAAGIVRGNGGAFKGIPYAAAPDGPLRPPARPPGQPRAARPDRGARTFAATGDPGWPRFDPSGRHIHVWAA